MDGADSKPSQAHTNEHGSYRLHEEAVKDAYGCTSEPSHRPVLVKALDIAQILPYGMYYGAYYGAKAINEVGAHLGPVGSVASHALGSLAVPFEGIGLGVNQLMDVGIKKLDPKAGMCEGFRGGIVPSFIDKNAPKVYLPGVHADGSIDFQW